MDSELELLHPEEIAHWPVLPGKAGLNFVLRQDGQRTTRYSLCDQGRHLGRPRGSMGLGIKLTMPRRRLVEQEEQEELAPLPFVVVCVVRRAARSDEAMALCVERGLGGERGYGLLQLTSRIHLVYDLARSPAWYVNQPPPGSRPTARLQLSRSRPWAPCVLPIGPLSNGAAVLMRYGAGSDHHRRIAAAQARRDARSPACNRRRREVGARMAALTARRLGAA